MMMSLSKSTCTLLAALFLSTPAGTLASNPFPAHAPLQDPPNRQQEAIDELLTLNAEISAANQKLAAELARVNLEVERLRTQNAELKQFIQDHDDYGADFEKYAFFREQKEREARARQAAQAKQKREEDRQRAIEERNRRRAKADPEQTDDEVLARRVEMLKRAGFTRVGDYAFVGEMGYSYRTDERETVRYSPIIEYWYTDRTEVIDYTELNVSGSIIHAGSEQRNISIALAFYDAGGAQLGSTTVQINAARPGVPYPFTATVSMTANSPFKRYSSWVLYDDPVEPPPMGENEMQPPPLDNKPAG